MIIAYLVMAFVAYVFGSRAYAGWLYAKTTELYWPVLCYLSRSTTGINTYAIASALEASDRVVYATLQRLHSEGRSAFVQVPWGDPKTSFSYSITLQGKEWIEEYRGQLEQAGLNPA